MAGESKGWARFGVFMAGVVSFGTIITLGIAIYDRATKPTSEVVGLVSASATMLPPDLLLSAIRIPAAAERTTTEVRDDGWSEPSLERQRITQSIVTVLIENTGALPATGVTLSLPPSFTSATYSNEDGKTFVIQSPRRISLDTVRAGQTISVVSWTSQAINEMDPSTLLKQISLTHNDGRGTLNAYEGDWAKLVQLEDNKRRSWLALALGVLSVLGGLISIAARASLQRRQLALLLAHRQANVIDGGGA